MNKIPISSEPTALAAGRTVSRIPELPGPTLARTAHRFTAAIALLIVACSQLLPGTGDNFVATRRIPSRLVRTFQRNSAAAALHGKSICPGEAFPGRS